VVDEEMLEVARAVIGAHLAPTPVVAWDGRWLKLETLQPTGSFKVRGALAAVAAYGGQGRPMVTASAGNHGLGMAYAAGVLGAEVTVVVPADASPAKVEALRELGADLVLHGRGYDAAERHALELTRAGATYVSAYTDPWVIAGQSTVVSELVEALRRPFTAVVPLGGGGLLAGSVLAAARSPHPVGLVGVETAASRAVSTAVAHGAVTPVPVGPTLADGLAGNLEPGALTPGIVSGRAELTAVSEESIVDAVRTLARRAGLVVEGSGAVGLAALASGRISPQGTVVLLVTGRNIATDAYARILAQP
jgi:threonine dehydratase